MSASRQANADQVIQGTCQPLATTALPWLAARTLDNSALTWATTLSSTREACQPTRRRLAASSASRQLDHSNSLMGLVLLPLWYARLRVRREISAVLDGGLILLARFRSSARQTPMNNLPGRWYYSGTEEAHKPDAPARESSSLARRACEFLSGREYARCKQLGLDTALDREICQV
jgi:hypothetical protein